MDAKTALRITALKKMREEADKFALKKIGELADFGVVANDMIDAYTEAQIILYDALDAAIEELRSSK